MLRTLAFALAFQSGVIPHVLPDTPQARQVSAYIEALNASEAAFVAMYDLTTTAEMAACTPPARRAELIRRLVHEVGKIQAEKLLSSSSSSITFSMRVPGKGSMATFTFRFEEKAPFRISGVDVEVSER